MESTNPQLELESLPVIRFRRSWRRILPWIILIIAFGWFAVWATAQDPDSVMFFRLTEDTLLPVPRYFLLWLVLTIRPAVLMLDARYEIGHHHIRAVTGRLSLHRHSVEIAYEDLLTVEVDQSILDRILFVGDVIAGSAMSDSPRIVMEAVGSPDYYAAQIDHRIDLTREQGRTRVGVRALNAA